MKLIIGLGNPEKKYEHTRHNVGFLAVDFIFQALSTFNFQLLTDWKLNKKSNSLITTATHNDEKLLFAKPQTFMNNSGSAVKLLVTDYGLRITDDVIIIHDDIDIAFGEFKIQKNRGPAGHNGVQSIITHLGTRDFTRVRIGILPQDIDKAKLDTQKFVLKNFSKKELSALNTELFLEISNCVKKLL